jgi:putative pyruvate formate lyase activating enzyme
MPHYGEEPPLVGTNGSGTIFISGCNLKCVFCQNYDISHHRVGQRVSVQDLARIMLDVQNKWGCHNINFVTPTHVTPQLMEAIHLARHKGLTVPIVYNCGGYEAQHTLKLLEGFVQIYMPDTKYADPGPAKKYSRAPDYPEVMMKALKEMHRQVGDLVIKDGLAIRGLLIRHLLMPNELAGTKRILEFIASEISPNSYVNVMAQYRPCYQAWKYEEINRRPTYKELIDAYKHAQQKGLRLAR